MPSAVVDALVVGAGPAGLSVALRLRQLGYRVLLIERSVVWPRPHIGEALTPGVQNIIALLDAHDALDGVPHLAGRPSRVLWRGREAERVADTGSAIVHRAHFDASLLALARLRGVEVERPAQLQAISGIAGDWRVTLRCGGDFRQVTARYIVEAGGRSTQARAQRLDCAPRLAAMWTDIPQAGLSLDMLGVTQTEAIEHGWLWGASLPGRRYRIMLVTDPLTARAALPGKPADRLAHACAGSTLFADLAPQTFDGEVKMCAATPYVAPDSWQDGRVKIGDAAFALDPISSSGVEKAMRFSLQAAVAIHTHLSSNTDDSAALARTFFEQRLIDATARHAHWTAAAYQQAWCAGKSFWKARAHVHFGSDAHTDWPVFQFRLRQACDRLQNLQTPALRPLAALHQRPDLRLSTQANLIQHPCVIADKVQMHMALEHPNLERPLAFLENEPLFPHLERLREPHSFDHVLRQFSTDMPIDKANKIVGWLWKQGVLENVNAIAN
ncbi:flavin-dependent monooxygenase QhpG [Pseudomonas costantinii]|uniref:Dehydrogenase (Flavoprotein) n=1 Tax=Pseudomonas costantinii TaxID=168469 RepID=A0A1H4ZIP0_9PSED|nr:tryptophan 7-halogenase [Pseudomonas costantinii]NVZ22730.1 tryptophan 7-halogenase [Pseudomonas costantinii]SED29354.1 Dehydrogenase (flavoprotein) [Pseudomonas costantinii]